MGRVDTAVQLVQSICFPSLVVEYLWIKNKVTQSKSIISEDHSDEIFNWFVFLKNTVWTTYKFIATSCQCCTFIKGYRKRFSTKYTVWSPKSSFFEMVVVYLFRKGLQLLRRTWTFAAFSEASSNLTQISNGLAEGLAMSLLLSKNESWFLSFLAELKTLNIITVSVWGWMCQEKVLFFTMAGTRNKVKRQGFSVA